MSVELIISEKPSAAKKIAEALSDNKPIKKNYKGVPYYELYHNGKKILVASAVGHLFSLEEKNKSFNYPVFDINWIPAYKKSKELNFTKKYIDTIKKLSKEADEITIATDYDIEGETIGLNIIRFICNIKDANRMKFSTVTKEDLLKAYENKEKSIDWGQANAGETRHFLDWYYGINISRALMEAIKKQGAYKILSTGRVQGPALKLIVDKEKEIKNFIPKPFWVLEALLHKIKDIKAHFIKERIFNKEEAEKIFNSIKNEKKALIKKIEKNIKKIKPPVPFDLGSLQTEVYRVFKIKPKDTLNIAQNLYSNGYISYPRTSSQQLPSNIGFKKILNALKKQTDYKEKVELLLKEKKILKPNNGKKTDPAHPAIYPTGYIPKNLNNFEKKIYDLIVKRFLATFGNSAEQEQLKAIFLIKNFEFIKKGSRIIKKGWQELYEPYAYNKEEELPELKENEEISIKKISLLEKETSPPKRYTLSSIISELEKRGLGTKSTRAEIIDNLFKRGYVEGTPIKPTELGIKTAEALSKSMPEIVDEELTRKFENYLEEIRNKKINKEEVLEKAKNTLVKVLNQFKKKENDVGKILLESSKLDEHKKNFIGKCPKCNGELRIKYSKNKNRFIGCSNYPECNIVYNIPQKGDLKLSDKKCDSCGFPLLIIKQGRNKKEFCFNPDCPAKKEEEKKIKKDIESNKKKCPKCGGELVLRRGPYGLFYGCSNYPKCKYTEVIKKNQKKNNLINK